MKHFYLELFERLLAAPYTHLEEETASYYTEQEGSTLRLFFEWSNGSTDWRNNLDFPAQPYRDMGDKWYAHRGFLRVWKAIEPHVADLIADPKVKIIEVAGYSHGAAVALLCHEYVAFHRRDVLLIGVGYGCPRVVWGKLPKKVRGRFSNFTVIRNGRDLVTHVPPRLLGYRHAGRVVDIGESRGQIRDHFPDAYAGALQEEAEEVQECG